MNFACYFKCFMCTRVL